MALPSAAIIKSRILYVVIACYLHVSDIVVGQGSQSGSVDGTVPRHHSSQYGHWAADSAPADR